MVKWLLLAVFAVTLLFFSVACGGDDNDSKSASKPTPAPTTPAVQILDLRSIDQGSGFVYQPATLTVKTGEVLIKYTNDSVREHNLNVKNKNGQGDLAKSAEFAQGQSGELKFTVTEEGQYEFYCNHTGHADRGLRSTLTVTRVGSQSQPGGGSASTTSGGPSPAAPLSSSSDY